ncbi:MAG: porin [Vicinamibacterales bacterium]
MPDLFFKAAGAVCLVAILFGIASPAQAQEPAPPPKPPTTVDASRGGVTISSGANSLTIGARIQFRWTLDDREESSTDTTGAGVGTEDGPISQFDIPRMRVSFTGGAFRPWLRYAFQFDFSRTGGESASKIKDALIEIRPVGRNYRVSAGQFKAPFGLQQLTSSGRLQFVDRAITDAKFNPTRDMGVMLSGTLAARKAGYDAGVFNGSGESVRQNNQSHLWAGRVYLQPLDASSLSEGSVDAESKPWLHLGLGARSGKQIRGQTTAGVVEDADNQTAVNAEFAVKTARIFSTAEYFWMTDAQDNPLDARDITSRGFHAQAAYMVMPKRAEVGLLLARITPDTGLDDAEVSEVRGVFGYYWHAHSLKLQADVGRLGYGANFGALPSRARQGLPSQGPRLVSGRSLTDTQIRVQLQLAF